MNWNTAKKFLLTTSLGMVLAAGAMAQVETLNMRESSPPHPSSRYTAYSQAFLLEEGDSFEVLSAGNSSRDYQLSVNVMKPQAQVLNGEFSRRFTSQNTDHLYQVSLVAGNQADSTYLTFQNKIVFGPAKIQLQSYWPNGDGLSGQPIVRYRINRAAAEAGGGGAGAEAGSSVKIPEGATGDVQVVMESSEDGITWVLAGPGPYPANGTRRQFRLRIINQ